jgi:hypothetical protein
MELINRVTWLALREICRLIAWIRRVWAAHLRLLRVNRAYEAAMAAAAANLVVQTRRDRVVAAVISGLFDGYAAIRRTTSRSGGPEFYGWDMP